ncbi:hypothetical protein [Nocardiopsis sp. FIRDI 009]|uniref:hypothetical protein n=1 Tax=Nocardiopsis sp. FIRDI 009 TaxID=714197 RepID=UPI000E27CB85|nr:hypothetical protein [Nocardiopsis sp. FIRDI 009]
MSRSRTPHKIRGLMAELADRYPGSRCRAEHDSGTRWQATWIDGPSVDRMRAEVARALPDVELHTIRTYTARSFAQAAVVMAVEGEFGPSIRGGLEQRAEQHLASLDNPHQDHATPRVAALADALIEHIPDHDRGREHTLLTPVAKEGLAWLLAPYDPAKADAPLVMSPAEHLTARYATGADDTEWRFRLRTLPAPVLVERASADTELDRVGRLAVLGLLDQMRRLWAATEGAAIAAARDAEAPGGRASWSQIGAALGGISKQGAQDRARRREKGGAVRLH